MLVVIDGGTAPEPGAGHDPQGHLHHDVVPDRGPTHSWLARRGSSVVDRSTDASASSPEGTDLAFMDQVGPRRSRLDHHPRVVGVVQRQRVLAPVRAVHRRDGGYPSCSVPPWSLRLWGGTPSHVQSLVDETTTRTSPSLIRDRMSGHKLALRVLLDDDIASPTGL